MNFILFFILFIYLFIYFFFCKWAEFCLLTLLFVVST